MKSTGDGIIVQCLRHKGKAVSPAFLTITCPSCFQDFEVPVPPVPELPAELDYDCEICCRPMVIVFALDEGEVRAEARGINE